MLHKCLFLSFFLNIILAAQVTKTDSTLNKNPKTAFYLSTVPGGGQLYNGKLLKGSLVFALESFAMYSCWKMQRFIEIMTLLKSRFLKTGI